MTTFIIRRLLLLPIIVLGVSLIIFSLFQSLWTEQIVKSPNYLKVKHLLTIDALINGRFDIFLNALKHIVGLVITLSFLWWAYLLRITRSSMLEVLSKEYVRTAGTKGVQERDAIRKPAKRNAMIPVVTVAGAMIIGLLSGTVIIAVIFNRTGIEQLAARAAVELDYATVLGTTLFYSIILVLGNLIIDILYAVFDPRVRLSRGWNLA